MRPPLLSAAVLPAALWTLVAARLHNSLVPEDPYAFPKYRVAFLNGLPVLNDTARRWLESGLRGGELEFLDQPWDEGAEWRSPSVKSIDGAAQDDQVAAGAADVGVLLCCEIERRAHCKFPAWSATVPELQARANENGSAKFVSLSDSAAARR